MKITYIIDELLFFKTTGLCTLNTKILKNILSSYESK